MDWIATRRVWPAKIVGRHWWPLWLWAGATLGIVLANWFEVRVVAASLFLFFLPGWAWLEAFSSEPQDGMWRILVAAGLSLGLTSLGTLYLAYLPGPLTEQHVLIMGTVLTLLPLATAFRRQREPLTWPDRRLWLLLLLVLGLAVMLRLPRLGYAEFHEDEVEVTSLVVRAIKGEDYAVFLHRKGPEQMLVPLAEWLLAGRITEGSARLPFALASILGVITVSMLAAQVAGWIGGLTAGLLLALNGYFVAFGRMVQYQALILFLVAIGLACLWRALEEGESKLIWPAALSLTVSLLAHYDALLFVPVAGYLAWLIWRRRPAMRRVSVISIFVAVAILLSFYLPYMRDPQFEYTQLYLRENRVGTDWLYNNLKTLFRLDADYSSRFYMPVLWALSLVVVVRYRPPARGWWLVGGGAMLAAWSTIRWSGMWVLNSWNLSLVPWSVVLLIGWIGLRRHRPGYESFWLWWGVPLFAYVFLVGDPRTHLYVAYPGWAMIAGLGAAVLWQAVIASLHPLVAAGGGVWAVALIVYQALIFLPTESTLLDLHGRWNGSIGQYVYARLPDVRSYFGYPRHAGWKGAGWLMSTGRFPADFRSVGEDFSVPIWYAFETPRSCYDDPQLYLVARSPHSSESSLDGPLAAEYSHAATIYSEDQARIDLFLKGQDVDLPARFDLTDLESEFDRAATPGRFIAGGQPAQALVARFGQVAQLTGFALSDQQVAAGGVLSVYLFWRSLAETEVGYRAFLHLGEDPVWGQHDDDPACRLPITLWRTGQDTVGQFRVVPSPETPAGDYPLVLGLYDPTTGQRLPVSDAQGQAVGDSLILTTVHLVEPQ
jgi:4-amino-4-deoxy-L-arabinose transferase-like glycosyltransferase